MKISPTFFLCLVLTLFLSSCASDASNTPDTTSSTKKIAQPITEDKTVVAQTQIETTTVSKKQALLKTLVGTYKLNGISAFMGANSMADYTKSAEKWTAYGSANSGGEREGFDIKLDATIENKLNTMSIEVKEDLTVELTCAGKTYFSAPFQADGMILSLTKAVSEYSELPTELNEKSTFVKNMLFLYVEDNLDSKRVKAIDLAEVGADAISLKYDTKEKRFEVSLFYGACCDNSTYIFN